MWPFSSVRRPEIVQEEPAPWIQEALQRTHAVVLEIERRQSSLEHGVSLQSEGVASAKQMELRVGKLEIAVRQLAAGLAEDISRLTSAVEVVRGYATGGRGGRPRNEEREQERQAQILGQRVIEAMSTPQGRLAFIQELQGTLNGQVGPVGNGTGSPV